MVFVFPVDKIAYVKFNNYARQITVAPIGAEAIFHLLTVKEMNMMKLKVIY